MSGKAPTAAALLRDATAHLARSGAASARLDAELLLMEALAISRETLILRASEPVAPPAAARFREALRRRLRGEPVAYILGRREFCGLDFAVTPDVLIPRPDSETLVDAVEAHLAQTGSPKAPRILDLGTGSGCLLLSLLHRHPSATGVGTDRSPDALAVAARNASAFGLAQRAVFREGDWYQALAKDDPGFDVLLSNPPYIPDDAIATLMPDVAKFEPPGALMGGPDGLMAYRAIARGASARLRPGGLVALEIGVGQAEDVATLLEESGLETTGLLHDLAGMPRVILARNRAMTSGS
ncbi:MAG: peptide chain release factor N(5)-glutamine methyltransferase [Rhodothalassiaceae bacterium]